MDTHVPIATKDQLKLLKEKELRERVLIPLLQRMGMLEVFHSHGTHELGKDIVARWPGPGNIVFNMAVVAKAGNITGSSVSKVAEQVDEALNKDYRSGQNGVMTRADMAWVITNGTIPDLSKTKIESKVGRSNEGRIRWSDIDELWNDWQTYFPVGLGQLKSQIQSELKKQSRDPAIMAREWVDENVRGTTIFVHDASKLTGRHTNGSIRFSAADTPESRVEREKFEWFLKTGAPIQLTGDYFSLRLPEAIQALLANSGISLDRQWDSIEIAPVPSDHRFPVKLEILCDDGDSASLDYVDWRVLQSGTEVTTFSNDAQDIPIHLTMSFNNPSSNANFSIQVDDHLVSASWTIRWMRLQRCLAKTGRMRISSVQTGGVIVEGPQKWDQRPLFDQDDFEFFREMEAIEQIIQTPIYVPEFLSGEDRESVTLIRELLRHPITDEVWTDGHIEFEVREDNVELDDLLEGKQVKFTFSNPVAVQLGGREVNLGRAEFKFSSMKLADPNKTRKSLEECSVVGDTIDLHVESGDDKRFSRRFIDFVDAPPALPWRTENC